MNLLTILRRGCGATTLGRWVFLAVAVGGWLIPLFWAGWPGKWLGNLPVGVRYQYYVAALFTQRAIFWSDYHLEYQDRSGVWQELPEDVIFPMSALGSRTRYDRLMTALSRQKVETSGRVYDRLATHALSVIRESAGSASMNELLGLRLVRSKWVVGSAAMRMTHGAWRKPVSTFLTPSQRTVLASYHIQSGRLIKTTASSQTKRPGEPTPSKNDPKPGVSVTPQSSSKSSVTVAPVPSSGGRQRLTPPLPLKPRGLPSSSAPAPDLEVKKEGIKTP